MKTFIKGGTIVNEGRSFRGDLIVLDDHIEEIFEGSSSHGSYDKVIDATGCFVLPGVIDEHVHFREPGLTQKADIESESRAAAYGGVTSYFEMPNTNPQTVTLEALEDKFERAKQKSHVNYSFFFGATNENAELFGLLDKHRIPGIKLFMGASTGNMLVDRLESLENVFKCARELNLPVMTHCEDTQIINRNMAAAKAEYGDDPDISLHPAIRSEEACYESSALAVKLARKYGTHLHIAHISTAKELNLLDGDEVFAEKNASDAIITGEACLAHLYFADADYTTKGAYIKCNPAVKTVQDRTALRSALMDGRITCIGTDHAPHETAVKQGGCAHAASGMPMLQYSLVTMLELVDGGVLTLEKMVELMCHNPAKLFLVDKRGFLRKGYHADITIVKPHTPFRVDVEDIQSKCKWSPMMGHEYQWSVVDTICNGHLIYNKDWTSHQENFDGDSRGEEIRFR
jgi:dihydroorotase